MPIRKITSSPKVLAVSLVLAIALLMFLGSISYKQIVQLGESAEMVSHSLEVDMEINQLFSYYAQMQSTELKNLLSHDTLGISSFENYKPEVQESFIKLKKLTQDNAIQQKILLTVQSWQDSLYNFISADQFSAKKNGYRREVPSKYFGQYRQYYKLF